MKEGFRIGFDNLSPLSSGRKNLQSAAVVSDYIAAEMIRGVLLGPFERADVPEVHLSRFDVIPKSIQLGKGRLIVNLSLPDGERVSMILLDQIFKFVPCSMFV